MAAGCMTLSGVGSSTLPLAAGAAADTPADRIETDYNGDKEANEKQRCVSSYFVSYMGRHSTF